MYPISIIRYIRVLLYQKTISINFDQSDNEMSDISEIRYIPDLLRHVFVNLSDHERLNENEFGSVSG